MTKVLLFLLAGFTILTVTIVSGVMFWTYSKIQSLPAIEEPRGFAAKFEVSDKNPVDLVVKTIGIYDDKGISTYFPYKSLKTITVFEDPCGSVTSKKGTFRTGEGSKYIMVDNLWQVFWVGIVKCDSDTKYFGPYKIGSQVPLD